MDRMLTTVELAEMLNITKSALLGWRRLGRGPSWIKFGEGVRGAVRYKLSDVEEWLEAKAAYGVTKEFRDTKGIREPGWMIKAS